MFNCLYLYGRTINHCIPYQFPSCHICVSFRRPLTVNSLTSFLVFLITERNGGLSQDSLNYEISTIFTKISHITDTFHFPKKYTYVVADFSMRLLRPILFGENIISLQVDKSRKILCMYDSRFLKLSQ